MPHTDEHHDHDGYTASAHRIPLIDDDEYVTPQQYYSPPPAQGQPGQHLGTDARLEGSQVHQRLTAAPAPASPAVPPAAPPGGGGRRAYGSPSAPTPGSLDGPSPAPVAEISNSPDSEDEEGGVDWTTVRLLRARAAEQLSDAIGGMATAEQREEAGHKVVQEIIKDHYRGADYAGQTHGAGARKRLTQAVLNSLFKLGRLQPLVDNDELENIEVYGYDDVWLIYGDGRIERGPNVADSDEELIETLQFLAARGDTSRPFSPTHPMLNLRLPEKHRVAANAWFHRPSVIIRRHRLVDISLDDMVGYGLLDPTMASLLRAAVRARKSIIVAGDQGAGKTTLLRALCSEIDPREPIATLETEYELYLHEMGERHLRCLPFEARTGSGERDANGQRLGQVGLDEIFEFVLRTNRMRTIVGEVRGSEIVSMFKAMQAGAGSMSTVHATSASAVAERLVTCAISAGPQVSEHWARTQVAQHIDLIVHVTLQDVFYNNTSGKRKRWIGEIQSVTPGEDGRPSTDTIYAPDSYHGRAVPKNLPSYLHHLTDFGFDHDAFLAQAEQARIAGADPS